MRTVAVLPDGLIVKDATVDISLAGIFLFGLLPADDPRVVSTMKAIEERLTVKTDIGGIARYENDYYFQISKDVANVPGNPWFVCTLWLAEWYIATARTLDDLERPRALLDWCRTKALPSGVLAEQVHPFTGEPLSVSPLTWSHAAFVSAIQHYSRESASDPHGHARPGHSVRRGDRVNSPSPRWLQVFLIAALVAACGGGTASQSVAPGVGTTATFILANPGRPIRAR